MMVEPIRQIVPAQALFDLGPCIKKDDNGPVQLVTRPTSAFDGSRLGIG